MSQSTKFHACQCWGPRSPPTYFSFALCRTTSVSETAAHIKKTHVSRVKPSVLSPLFCVKLSQTVVKWSNCCLVLEGSVCVCMCARVLAQHQLCNDHGWMLLHCRDWFAPLRLVVKPPGDTASALSREHTHTHTIKLCSFCKCSILAPTS